MESLIPGVTNLLVLLRDTPEEPTGVERRLRECWLATQALNVEGRQIDIPVCYGGEHATDLRRYVAIPGFPPGSHSSSFAGDLYRGCAGQRAGVRYLHGLDPRLATPRKGAFAEYA